MKKKEFADLAVRLFNNIDQADQFNINELFYHCDNEFLLEIIESLAEIVRENAAERGKRFSTRSENVSVDDEELEEIFTLVSKVLKSTEREEETELLSCPFCGGEAEVEQIPGATWDKFVAHCKNSKCIAFYIGYYDEGLYETRARAVTAWNTRVLRRIREMNDCTDLQKLNEIEERLAVVEQSVTKLLDILNRREDKIAEMLAALSTSREKRVADVTCANEAEKK